MATTILVRATDTENGKRTTTETAVHEHEHEHEHEDEQEIAAMKTGALSEKARAEGCKK